MSILETSPRFEFDKLQFSKMENREDYLQDKLLVNVAFGHGGLEVRALQETQKELIHQLTERQMAGSQVWFRQPYMMLAPSDKWENYTTTTDSDAL